MAGEAKALSDISEAIAEMDRLRGLMADAIVRLTEMRKKLLVLAQEMGQ